MSLQRGGTLRVVRLDQDYMSPQELLGICEIDGAQREVVWVFDDHRSGPLLKGELVVLRLSPTQPTTHGH
jgi:hypothetical protein